MKETYLYQCAVCKGTWKGKARKKKSRLHCPSCGAGLLYEPKNVAGLHEPFTILGLGALETGTVLGLTTGAIVGLTIPTVISPLLVRGLQVQAGAELVEMKCEKCHKVFKVEKEKLTMVGRKISCMHCGSEDISIIGGVKEIPKKKLLKMPKLGKKEKKK